MPLSKLNCSASASFFLNEYSGNRVRKVSIVAEDVVNNTPIISRPTSLFTLILYLPFYLVYYDRLFVRNSFRKTKDVCIMISLIIAYRVTVALKVDRRTKIF